MTKIDLTGRWELQHAGRDDAPLPASVPGDVHSALLASKAIPDPYWGTNELDVQWIGREDWVYSRGFKVTRSLLANESVILNAERLDTFADIFINGKKAAASSNMFTRVRVEVKHLLQPGDNKISIRFRSAEKAAIAAARKLPYEIPHGSNPVQSPHRNLVRKVQCHSGWDWGCCLMVAGIYDDIYLAGVAEARIDYVYTEQRHSDAHCDVDVICEVFSPAGGRTAFSVSVGEVQAEGSVDLPQGASEFRTRLHIPKPRLWWPNGYGVPHLYDLAVNVGDARISRKVGLRTIEIINEDDDIGRSFIVRVNGIDVFCKGANWIPPDALPQRHTRDVYGDLLASAADAHMNMIRVWGGGQYELDEFYEICDEKGLLVWQDFMFSCALYPATPGFLENVRQEAVHQVKRLRNHACIALWCGDNENVGALNWYDCSRDNRDLYLVDYDRLNNGVLAKAVREHDPTRVFWPSSPCGGPGDFSDNWHDDSKGDMHYWTVWHGGKPFSAYYDVIPRFCSEFGYQSFPSMDVIRSYAPRDQLNVTSPIMEHHQRNTGGNGRIVGMFAQYFRMPEGFENFVYLSQVQQGLAIKTGVEHWRRLRPTCMGTIYWQLNDVWPVCSWSSLNYGGKWKILHYMAKRFYAPLVVSAFQTEDGRVEIWATSDLQQKKKVTIRVAVHDLNGKVQRSETLQAELRPGSSRKLKSCPVDELTADANSTFMTLTLRAGSTTFRNEHFFAEYKKCTLPHAKVKTRVKRSGTGFDVTLTTDRPAFFTTLDAEGVQGEFDDNAVLLLPAKARTLRFTPKESVTLERFKSALNVRHLRMTYP